MGLMWGDIPATGIMYNGVPATAMYNGQVVWPTASPVRTLTLQSDANGTVSADMLTGYDGDVVTLSTNASAHYHFNEYAITGAELTANQFTFNGEDVTVSAGFNIDTYDFLVGANGTASSTTTVTYNGATTSYGPYSANTWISSIPYGATVKMTSTVPTYWRMAGLITNSTYPLSGWNQTKSSNSRGATGSGIVTSTTTATVSGSAKASFTAYGVFPSGSSTAEAAQKAGHWMPHRITALAVAGNVGTNEISANYSAEYRTAQGTAWSTAKTGSQSRFKTAVKFSGFSAHVLATARKTNTNSAANFKVFISNVTSVAKTQAANATSTNLTMDVARAGTASGTTAVNTNMLTLYNSANNTVMGFYSWWSNALFSATGLVP